MVSLRPSFLTCEIEILTSYRWSIIMYVKQCLELSGLPLCVHTFSLLKQV